MLKPDIWIKKMAETKGMIEPFVDHQVRDGKISYGLSSYGYDIRLGDEFRVPKVGSQVILDPKSFPDDVFETVRGSSCVIPAGSYVIARSFEYFRIPREVSVLCTGKSTYARCGVIVNVTPLEPEWEGIITMSIANVSGFPVKLHTGEGVAQILFLEGSEVCAVSYADKKGKYQAQQTITLPKL